MRSLRVFALSLLSLLSIASYAASTVMFAPRQNIPTGFKQLSGYATGDFNGDGRPDLAFTDATDKRDVVYLNNGAGGFGAPISTNLNVSASTLGALVAGDVNEDGKQDLVVSTAAATQTNLVLLGNGDGTFAQGTAMPNSSGFFQGLLVDLNGDKHLDFVSASNGAAFAWLGDGAGHFTAAQTASGSSNFYPSSIAVGDFNGDGKIDLFSGTPSTSTAAEIYFFAGKGDGTFAAPTMTQPLGSDFNYLSAGDFNGDGKLDLAFSTPTEPAIALGNGDGTIQAQPNRLVSFPSGTSGTTLFAPALATADLDGDGKPDVIVANRGDSQLYATLNLNNGTGKFASTPAFQAALDPDTFFVITADLNGDGLPDVIAGSYTTNNIEIFLSVRPKTTPTVTLTATPVQSVPGSAVALTATVAGTSGTPTGTVTFADGTTSLGQVALNTSGQATFSTTSLAVGQHSFSATYAGDTSFNTASSAAVAAGVVDFSLTLGAASQTITAGGTATYTATITGTGGLAGMVALSCSGLPAGYSCTGTSATAGAQPATATLTVAPSAHAALQPGTPNRMLRTTAGATLACLALTLGIAPGRRRSLYRAGLMCTGTLLLTGFGLSGCGGSSSNTATTYHGTTNFTIAATTTVGSQVLTHQTTATLTVQ